MTQRVTVFGFGSAFARIGASDVDLLILHQSTDLASCRFAIACKRYLQDSVINAHITMLSNAEEQHCHFIETSQAVRLGTIHEQSNGGDLKLLHMALSLATQTSKSHE